MIIIIREHEQSHWGTDKTYKKLKELYTWEGMKTQIDEYIKSCDICQPHRRHYSHNSPGVIIDPPTEPFEILNADLFYRSGKAFLILIDKLSRYI